MRLGNGLQRLGMNGQNRAITGIGDAIRGKRGRTAYLGMQIGQVRAQTRILRKRVAQKICEHPIMITLQHAPIRTIGNSARQIIDHAPAVRPPVHQIADMDNGRGSGAGHIGSDQGVQLFKFVQMAVDVANRISVHFSLRPAPASEAGLGARAIGYKSGFHRLLGVLASLRALT